MTIQSSIQFLVCHHIQTLNFFEYQTPKILNPRRSSQNFKSLPLFLSPFPYKINTPTARSTYQQEKKEETSP
jgi:hypothetical protein